MSDNNKKSGEAAKQTKQTQPSHYELSRAYAKQGAHNSTVKAMELGRNPPTSKEEAATFAAKAGAAGLKEYGKSAYHAGMGFMEGVSKQNPNSGQQLNNMKTNQAIAQGSQQAKQSTVNKGIEAARQKTAAKPTETGQSTNKGIASYQSKTSGQSSSSTKSSASKSSESGSSKGSSSGQSSSGSKGNSR